MDAEHVEILVVDDVQAMRVQIAHILKELGFRRISLAMSGEEAWTALNQRTFHLVICDWYMSPTDGLELLKKVRASFELKNIAFVLVTAENTVEKVKVALLSGVDDYVVKPVTSKQLGEKVARVLVRKKIM
jgi:two-component system chemotaxis response regulator CheY